MREEIVKLDNNILIHISQTEMPPPDSDVPFEVRSRRVSDMHLHNEYEIYYNISGGKGFFIDEHYYECNPHDLFIIRKLHIHRECRT